MITSWCFILDWRAAAVAAGISLSSRTFSISFLITADTISLSECSSLMNKIYILIIHIHVYNVTYWGVRVFSSCVTQLLTFVSKGDVGDEKEEVSDWMEVVKWCKLVSWRLVWWSCNWDKSKDKI